MECSVLIFWDLCVCVCFLMLPCSAGGSGQWHYRESRQTFEYTHRDRNTHLVAHRHTHGLTCPHRWDCYGSQSRHRAFWRERLKKNEVPGAQSLFPATCCTSNMDACGKQLHHWSTLKPPYGQPAHQKAVITVYIWNYIMCIPHLVFVHVFVCTLLVAYPLRIKCR